MIWFDLDNSPHVPLFRPILKELEHRKTDYFVTARAHAQTEELLSLWGTRHILVGMHGGKSKFWKILNLMQRSTALMNTARGKPITLAMSHGSRTHLVAAKRMRIPYIWMQDYEYQEKTLANLLADYILLPAYIPDARVSESGYKLKKVIRYEGFKEQIYLKDFVPAAGFRKTIGVDEGTILITMRPPAVTANYHDHASEGLFAKCLEYFSSQENTCCLVINRTKADRTLIPRSLEGKDNIIVLGKVVDGLQLLWSSDLVIGGGGTMNRESALLGVPTFSIFTGRRPYMDELLQEKRRLTFIENAKQIEGISVKKRAIGDRFVPENTALALKISEIIIDISSRFHS